jgi:tetratricopeptide (TPR) repeat protein
MKNYMIIAVSLALGTMAYGQTLEEAIKKSDNERYDLAAKDFNALIAKEPAKADNYFYFAESLMKKGETEAAYTMWQKGAAADPASPLGMVANGKILWYKGDTAAARKIFVNACTVTKHKNAEVMRQVGAAYTYAPIKNLDGAIKLLNDAIKLDPKNIEGYMILGDALLVKTPSNGSPAIAQYNKVLDIDPKNPRGIVRKGKLYQSARAYKEANELFIEAQTLDPTYAPAYRENAELNMLFDQHTKAIENWKKYLELNDTDDARYQYAISLFSGKKYCESLSELQGLQSRGFVNMYTHRLISYSLYECNPDNKPEINQQGLAESDEYFKMAPKDKLIAADYKYRGMHYSKMGNDSLAILEYEKAIELDSSARGALSADIAKMHMKAKKYDLAIKAYLTKMDGKKENLKIGEYFELGRAYYFGPKDYILADSAFKQVTILDSTYAMGYMWRARANYKLDPTNKTWAAKPYYEEFLNKLTAEDKVAPTYKATQIEAGKYLGDYYVNSKEGKDYAKAKLMWKMVQDLDPADKQAKAFFASPAGK